jgi:hypothetical protein
VPQSHAQAEPEPTPFVNLNATETARRLGVSPGTLANWRSAVTGPAYLKIGSRVMYPIAALVAFESAALVEPLDSAQTGPVIDREERQWHDPAHRAASPGR